MKCVLCSQHAPPGTVKGFFIALHFNNAVVHGLLWMESAPKYRRHENENIYVYNDKIISCSTDISEEELQYVFLQKHKHSKTCMKVLNGQKTHPFGALSPPMHATVILEPLDVDVNAQCVVYVSYRVR